MNHAAKIQKNPIQKIIYREKITLDDFLLGLSV